MPDTIPFERLWQFDVATHAFEVCSAKLPKVVSTYDDFFERTEVEAEVLRDCLLRALKRRGETIERLVLVHEVAKCTKPLGFVYLKNRSIRPVRFRDEATLTKWLDAMFADFTEAPAFTVAFSAKSIRQSPIDDFAGDASLPALVRASAPEGFDSKKQTREDAKKKDFLEKHRTLPAMRSRIDANETAALWRSYLATTKPAKVGRGATAVALDALEKKLGLALPRELRALYAITNGGSQLFPDNDLLSLEQVFSSWRSWKEIFDEWTLDDLQGNSRGSNGKTLGMYTTPRWVPFTKDGGGNHWAFDLMPGKKGSVGQIIEFGPDLDTIRCLAPDLNTLLRDLTKRAARGPSRRG